MTNIGIFASGGPGEGEGGSGARKLLERMQSGEISGVEKVVVISNHIKGGVAGIVEEFQTQENPFSLEFFPIGNFPKRGKDGQFSAEDIVEIRSIGLKIMEDYNLDHVFLSGWIKYILGIPTEKIVNIHPGPTQEPYGGVGMHGSKVHEKVWEDYKEGKIQRTCITMHYVTPGIDEGSIICQIPVEIDDCTSALEVAKKVKQVEHEWQWKITDMIIKGEIFLKDRIVQYPKDFAYKGETDLGIT